MLLENAPVHDHFNPCGPSTFGCAFMNDALLHPDHFRFPPDRSVNDLDLLGVALMVKPFMLAGKAAASDAAVTEGRSCWQSRRLCFV